MEDIAPILLKKIQADFKASFDKNKNIKALYEKIEKGTATYKEASDFAAEIGEMLSKAFKANVSSDILPDGRMYYNIADRVIREEMGNKYNLVADVCTEVQAALNAKAKIGIKAIRPELNEDKVSGIVNIVSESERYDDVAYMLGEPIVNFMQAIVDDSVRANADFQFKAGMRPKIIRTSTGKCCEWCNRLAGVYDYEAVSDTGNDVFRRHKYCRCLVEYDPGEGKLQNVHTKKWSERKNVEERIKNSQGFVDEARREERKRWSKAGEHGTIEARKVIGLIAEDDVIMKNIRENVIPKQNIDRVIERQQIHRVGTQMYEQRKTNLQNKGQYGPSYLTISDEEVLELVQKYSGKGQIKYTRNGEWNSQEIILTNDRVVGVVVNNRNGVSVETSVFKIHYSKEGIHIVPDYPSKKR